MQEAAVAKTILDILSLLSTGPLSLLLLVLFIVPPLAISWSLYKLATALVDLRDEVRKDNTEANGRYDNNVELVKNYELMARELVTMIRLNTGAMEQLSSLIKHKLTKG